MNYSTACPSAEAIARVLHVCAKHISQRSLGSLGAVQRMVQLLDPELVRRFVYICFAPNLLTRCPGCRVHI